MSSEREKNGKIYLVSGCTGEIPDFPGRLLESIFQDGVVLDEINARPATPFDGEFSNNANWRKSGRVI
jgi:hypothetical protein